MTDYFDEKTLIPKGNLSEIRFEDLESNPLSVLDNIYKDLNIGGFKNALPKFKKYVENISSYKKNKHKISKVLLDTLIHEWGFAMIKLKYEIPGNIEIIQKTTA